MARVHKLFLILILLLTLILSVFLPIAAYALDSPSFDRIDVMDDLNATEGFNIYHYGFNGLSRLKLFNFVEYAYSPFVNESVNFGLYVYLYNPTNIKFDKNGENAIELAVGSSPISSDTRKYRLKFLSATTGNYANLFYKFKIIGADDIYSLLSSNKRIYNISGIELDTDTEGIVDYGIGGQYAYTGYAAGYNPDTAITESTLDCKIDKIETLRLNPEQTYYRLNGEKENGNQDNLSTVYFSIPQKFKDEYGTLCGVHAIWDEYHTAPMLVVNNNEIYTDLAKSVGKASPNSTYGFYTKNETGLGYAAHWNSEVFPNMLPELKVDKITLLIDTDNTLTGSDRNKFHIPSSDIVKRWNEYTRDYSSASKIGKYNSDLFLQSVDQGRKLGANDKWIRDSDNWNLTAYTYGDSFSKYWQQLFGIKGNNASLTNIKPIYEVTAADMNSSDISSRLLISPYDEKAFTNYYNGASAKNELTYLFRFAVTEYKASEVQFFNASSGLAHGTAFNHYGLISQQTAFLNFDILDVEFRKGEKYTKIQTVMNPIDVIGGITPDYKPDKGLPDWLKWLLFFISLPFIVWFICKLPKLIVALWSIISFPFKLISKGISALRKVSNGKGKGTKHTKASAAEKEAAKRRLKR